MAMSDRFGDLSDCVLLHIMKFMKTKNAVRTCVLSKRWKDLWKRLTILSFDITDFSSFSFYNKFVTSLLSCRDDSFSLHKLHVWHYDLEPGLLNRIMTYAASHHVQQLLITVSLSTRKDFELSPSFFHCRSLTYLQLSFWPTYPRDNQVKLPKSLELPALKRLYIQNVTFATSDNGYAEPFSTCNMLNTLVMQHCYLLGDAKVLYISNLKLFSLTIKSFCDCEKGYEIKLSTPNLNLLAMEGYPVHQLSSTCNISCLEEVIIRGHCLERHSQRNNLVLTSWLQVLISVKILTLSWTTPRMFNDLLSRGSIRAQLPSFVRLKSLKLMEPFSEFSNISDEEISMMMEYLLQNSPLTSVDILKC